MYRHCSVHDCKSNNNIRTQYHLLTDRKRKFLNSRISCMKCRRRMMLPGYKIQKTSEICIVSCVIEIKFLKKDFFHSFQKSESLRKLNYY